MADDFDELFEPKIPREAAVQFLSGLKLAVSDLWLHKATQAASKSAPVNRLVQSATKNMQGALNAVKAGGPRAEEAARKRLVVRHGARAEMLDRAGSLAAAPNTLHKAAEDLAPVEVEPGVEAPVEPEIEPGVSAEELALFVSQLVTHEFKMHQWYTYYAEMLRGTDRGGLVELFEELAPMELEDAKYFLRRLSVLSPAAMLPVVPNPKPSTTADEIVKIMLVEEQRAVALLQHLHQLCGDDPMRFMVEQMISEEQIHADRLQQFMNTGTKAQKIATKLAAAMEAVKQQLVPDEAVQAQQIAVEEQAAQAAQLQNENVVLQQRLREVSAIAQEHAQSAQDATSQAQQLGEQAAAAQDQAMASDQQAQLNLQEAASSQQAAAQEADAKARLAIRIQQTRQRLSELVAEDPVTEEGADIPAIPTATQMGGMDPAAAQQDPAAQSGATAEPVASAQQAPAGAEAAVPEAVEPSEKEKSKKLASKVEIKLGSTAVGALAGLGILGAGAYGGYRGGEIGAQSARELAQGKAVSESSPGLRRAALIGGTLLSPATLPGYVVGRLKPVKDEPKVSGLQQGIQRAGELVTGSGVKRIKEQAGHHFGNAAIHLKNNFDDAAVRSIAKGDAATKAAVTEGRKVVVSRAALGTGVGAAGLAASHKKEAGVLHRAVDSLRNKAQSAKARVLTEAAKDIAGNPEVKKKIELAAQEAKKSVQHGAKQVAGISAGAGAVSTGTSIYQGNKTRRAVKEHHHA